MKKLLIELILFTNICFLLYISPSYAGYPTLLKNNLVDENDTGSDYRKTIKDDKEKENKNIAETTSFNISASVGFSDLTYSGGIVSRKPGLITKISSDYWISNHFGLGLEFAFHYLFGRGYSADAWYDYYDEKNYYLSPCIKLGLLSGSNWRIFFDLGLGFGGAKYDGDSTYSNRIFLKFALGWSIKISKNIQTGLTIDNKLLVTVGEPEGAFAATGLFLFSIYPFIGYVF
jgi:hypothetical protein